ncbi:MAG TPA: histidine kinase dimerization/phospho-acceptor domain-containing protein, partial [Chitinophagaceae bacterium]|nr:histidine kinase dimerization/phospho-acceptor domain-containing protein [Chitinophagaceae bacterium]
MEIISSPQVKHPDFLAGHGEMKERIRNFDWASTPLGSIDSWSPSLRTMVGILLSNRFPMLLWWGPSYISLYNDAYIPILGTKHPRALGQPVSICWNEIWHILQPLIDSPFKGGPSTWMEDIELEINRNGFFEETHFTIAYSPVPDETMHTRIGGVLATVNEITEKVIGERRVNILRKVAAHSTEAKTKEEACALAAEAIMKHQEDIPFAMFYLIDQDNQKANLAGTAGIKAGEQISPAVIELTDESSQLQYSNVMRTGRPELGIQLSGMSNPENLVCVIPIPSNKPHHYEGIIVLGVSPRLQFNESYISFFELLTTQVATAVANAGAFEEERKRSEALEQIDRAKTAFFSNISHEFRTPLTLMLGPLEELINEPHNNLSDGERQNITTAHRNAMRLLKLVNSLLDFSRIEAGRQQANFSLEDMATTTKNLA